MMKKYKMITFCALIAAGVTSCELDEKPTSYYEKDAYFQTYNHAKMAVVGIYDCLAIDKHYGQFEMQLRLRMIPIIYRERGQTIRAVILPTTW